MGPDSGMTTFHATWLANVTGVDGAERVAFSRIGDPSVYRNDDTFVVGWQDDLAADSVEQTCELMWVRHNADDRPSRRTCRSMCMGDVVVVGEVAYACEAMGFRRLDAAPGRIEPGTYVEHCEANR